MQYKSPFEDWYTYSTVHKPLPDFTCEAGLVLFPPELVPGVGHPLVEKLGNHAVRRLTMRKLESYNAFTEKLEYKAVMAASIKIAQNPQAFGLSEQAGREARLIVTDESHHAYVAIELIKQIPGFSELPPLTPSQPPFLRGLEELERDPPTEFADDLLIAFVSISETLIIRICRNFWTRVCLLSGAAVRLRAPPKEQANSKPRRPRRVSGPSRCWWRTGSTPFRRRP